MRIPRVALKRFSMTTHHSSTSSLHHFSPASGITRTRLQNGLTILTKPLRDKPLVSSMIWYRVGSRNEEAGQTGKSHFLEHMLFKGTDRYAKGEIDLLTLQHGGANNAFTDTDYTAYYFNFASDRWQVALDIEASRMLNNAFVPEEFEAEKQVVEEELRIGLDGPWEALDQAVWAAAFQQHPYHNPVIGWLDDLERTTREEMIAYYRQWYHPRNATLVIVGDIDEEQTIHRVSELFGDLPAGVEAKPLAIRESEQRGERRVIVRKETELERLQMGWHVPEAVNADAYPLQLLMTLLGTGRTARLYQRLEEQDQSVTSQSVEYADRIDPTLFVIRAEIKPDHEIRAVESAIIEEIEKFQQSPVSESELRRARQLIRARLIMENEQVTNQAILLGYYETVCGYEYLADYFEKLEAVTAQDIQRVAQNYLTADNCTVGHLMAE
jgi:zinc protease